MLVYKGDSYAGHVIARALYGKVVCRTKLGPKRRPSVALSKSFTKNNFQCLLCEAFLNVLDSFLH